MQQPFIMSELDHARLSDVLRASPAPADDHAQAPEHATLARKLRHATLVPPAAVPRNVVTMRSLVQLRDLQRNEKFSCTLSFPDEADPDRYRVSVTAPLGATMVATAVGDVLDCPTPSGTRQLRVERIYYQPEAARDYDL